MLIFYKYLEKDRGQGRVYTLVLKLINRRLDSLSRDLYESRLVRGPFESSPPGPFGASPTLVDSSLFAFGGVMGCQAYHLPLPDHLAGSNISFLELLNIHVALHSPTLRQHHLIYARWLGIFGLCWFATISLCMSNTFQTVLISYVF